MAWVKLSLSLVVFNVLVVCTSSWLTEIVPTVPVMNRQPGYVMAKGDRNAKIMVEVFLELNCGDSKLAWGVLKSLAEAYEPEEVAVVLHHLPLPYHRNAYLLTQGFYLVEDKDPKQVYNYVDAMFDNLSEFSESATVNKTENDVISLLANVAYKATGIDTTTFIDEIDNYAITTRDSWKYAVRRSAGGTPWYFANGVDLGINSSTYVALSVWEKFINGLLAA